MITPSYRFFQQVIQRLGGMLCGVYLAVEGIRICLLLHGGRAFQHILVQLPKLRAGILLHLSANQGHCLMVTADLHQDIGILADQFRVTGIKVQGSGQGVDGIAVASPLRMTFA